ncbi:cytochrome P450 [Streptomyces sp. NPDC101227]|uniref:cytochrome P450 n=1 Tax=Streptomyces sp. NPDC101227 TaxID=3366136 RepID=UPI003806DCA8
MAYVPPGAPAPPITPQHGLEPVPLYGDDFAAHPHATYDRLRTYGALAPVEIAPRVHAMLVTEYRAALDVLQNREGVWTKDSRSWAQTIAPDSPVFPMLADRPNPLHRDGEEHNRYRQVIADGFNRIEPHVMRRQVHELADSLIHRFGGTGTADLIEEYAAQLPLLLFNRLVGLPDESSSRLITALAGVMEASADAAAAAAAYDAFLAELTESKKRNPGQDLTSWFLEHPKGLSDAEVAHQIALAIGAGYEPTAHLIGNALARMLSDDRYYKTLTNGSLTPTDAIRDVFHHEPPLANYAWHYPKRDLLFHGTWLRAGQLVLISFAAANTQFGQAQPGSSGGGAHLSWSAGPHACPVPRHALLIATTAIERLTALLSDVRLTVPYADLEWRHGPFVRGLAHLPVAFTPLNASGSTPWRNAG